jgi:hypothetical protein
MGGQGGGEYADPLEQWKCAHSARNSGRAAAVQQYAVVCLVI